jgi:hypothetical protein
MANVGVATTKGRRGVVTVRFGLSRASRVAVVLRGPLPDCARVARFVIRGRAGTNALRFTGRVGRRRLAQGTYLIGVRPGSSGTMRWVAVRVGPRGAVPLPRTVVDPALARCAQPSPATAFRLDGAAAGALPRTTGRATDSIGGTRGEQSPSPAPPPISVLPFESLEQVAADLPDWIGYVVLALVTASLGAIIFLVIRFLRAPGSRATTE